VELNIDMADMNIQSVKTILHEVRDIFASGGSISLIKIKVEEAILELIQMELESFKAKQKLDQFCLEYSIDKKRFPQFFKKDQGYEKGDEEAPFLSEACLYNLIGKEDARTVRALIGNLERLLGVWD